MLLLENGSPVLLESQYNINLESGSAIPATMLDGEDKQYLGSSSFTKISRRHFLLRRTEDVDLSRYADRMNHATYYLD